MKLQVEPNHYYNIDYDTKQRFCSYWHQIQEIRLQNPKEVLEIGMGNGFVSRYLKERGVNIVTLDIDERLKPDVVGSILNIPFGDNSFEVVACYELLEHLPYESVVRALSEVARVSKKYVILSLPDVCLVYRIYIHVPWLGEIRKLLTIPRIRRPVHKFDGQHYWEIGKVGYPLRRIIEDVHRCGLQLLRTYRVHENPSSFYHTAEEREGHNE